MNMAAVLNTEDTTLLNSGSMRLPPDAGLWIDNVRSAFLSSAAQRRDRHAWEKLERTVTAMLAQRRHEVSQMDPLRACQQLARADLRLRTDAGSLLNRADPSRGRAECFYAAAVNVAHSRAYVDEIATAFCHHAALVWLALWHLSDIWSILPKDVHDHILEGRESASASAGGSTVGERSSHVLARTLKAAAAALRKADEGGPA